MKFFNIMGVATFVVIFTGVSIGFLGCDATTGEGDTNNYYIDGSKKTEGWLTDSYLYANACDRATVAAGSNSIKTLICIKTDRTSDVEYNAAKDSVLMCIFHNNKETYENEDGSAKGEITFTVPDTVTNAKDYKSFATVTSAKEFKSWKKNHKDDRDKITELRLKKLLGLPVTCENKYMAAIWVKTSDLRRPAYQSDITKQVQKTDLDINSESSPLKTETAKITIAGTENTFFDWFNSNLVQSYYPATVTTNDENPRAPWTRMGYTYDWSNDSVTYGLSEFIIIAGGEDSPTKVTVEWNKTVAQFADWLSE